MQYWKLEPSDPLYKSKFGDVDIRQFKVVTNQRDKIGKVLDALSDGQQSVYLHIETGSWLSPEWIVVPLGEFQIEAQARAIHLLRPIATADAHSSANLPIEVNGHSSQVAQPVLSNRVSTQTEPVALGRSDASMTPVPPQANRLPLRPEAHPDEAETIRLLEERLLVEQHRRKVGEVVVHKVVDTQMIQVPVRRERLVVEQVSPERKQLATIDLGQGLDSVQALEPNVRHQINGAQESVATASLAPAATLASTQQFLTKLAQRPQIAKAKLRLVFEDPELQSYYQRWLDQG